MRDIGIGGRTLQKGLVTRYRFTQAPFTVRAYRGREFRVPGLIDGIHGSVSSPGRRGGYTAPQAARQQRHARQVLTDAARWLTTAITCADIAQGWSTSRLQHDRER